MAHLLSRRERVLGRLPWLSTPRADRSPGVSILSFHVALLAVLSRKPPQGSIPYSGPYSGPDGDELATVAASSLRAAADCSASG